MVTLQARSEESAELLAEKARIAEEEALLLRQKDSETEAEIKRMRLTSMKVGVSIDLFSRHTSGRQISCCFSRLEYLKKIFATMEF